ncbi:hypothetical protein GWK47_019701 [Chionoecetes opilio]|uniref:Uncharacterized protein n=1 Tax=Chionoecetes opilio TaxID=41210 RepID=A0A8J4XRZ4_CHIOP|nr:hypothetical protein GWK47_019701 [Chionoecetes opilio]
MDADVLWKAPTQLVIVTGCCDQTRTQRTQKDLEYLQTLGLVEQKAGDSEDVPFGEGKTEEGSGRQVTRKNSLRDRLRQLHTPFNSERRRQPGGRGTQDTQKSRKKSTGDQTIPQKDGGQQQHQIEEKAPLASSTTTNTIATTNTTTTTTTPSNTNTTISIVTMPISIPTLTSNLTLTTTSTVAATTAVSASHGAAQISALQVTVGSHHQATIELQVGAGESSAGGQRQRPRYMLPTRASSQHSPARPSSIDLDSCSGSSSSKASMGLWSGTPPSSGRCSPSKFEVSRRRGSVGGESPVRSGSPRRGSLDCLAWPHPQALSPPTSPLHTPIRSSHGSASSLLASEEYREGSPEKLWISSLRTDASRAKGMTMRCFSARKDGHSRSGSGENIASDRLKRTALYHPPLLRGRSDPMKPAFELVLDPSSGQFIIDRENLRPSKTPTEASQSGSVGQAVTITLTRKPQRQPPSDDAGTPPRPEVPPRTKFLSPSERTLTSSSSPLPSSPPYRHLVSCPSSSTLPISPAYNHNVSSSPTTLSSHKLISSPSFLSSSSPGLSHPTTIIKNVPNLTIRTTSDDTETVRTPLKLEMEQKNTWLYDGALCVEMLPRRKHAKD